MGVNDAAEMLEVAKAECLRLERTLADAVEHNVIQAVLEAYDARGVTVWFASWGEADPQRRRRMERAVVQEWSGQDVTLADIQKRDGARS